MIDLYDMEHFKSDCYKFNSIAGKDKCLSPEDIKKQLDLIQEELNETYLALEELDYVKILDGYCDILVTSFGLGQQLEYLGINTKLACEDTSDNNLSKFLWEEDDVEAARMLADESVKFLEAQNVKATVYFSEEFGCYVLKDEKNKIRKPVSFRSNNLSRYVPEILQDAKLT